MREGGLNHQSVNGEPANSTQRSSLRFGPCGLHYPPSSPRGHSIPLKFILVSPRFLLFLVPLSNGDQVPTSPCSLGNDPVRLRELLTDMNSRLVLLPAHPTQELNSKTSSVGFSFLFSGTSGARILEELMNLTTEATPQSTCVSC